jgi:P27 family predicted phage terminase small subunit
MGNRKRPLALVKLEGNPGHRKLPSKDEEVTAVPGAPKCPAWLDATARAEWARVVPLLNAQGTLAQIDMAGIAGYCYCYSVVVKYHASKVPAEQNLVTKHLQRMQSFASLLGMSPSDRAKLSIPGRKADDEMGELLDKQI